MERSIEIASLDQLGRVVAWLDQWIEASGSRVVALYGQMGSGKTTLTSLWAKTRGARQTPASPTFGVVHTYDTPTGPIYHFDLYRIERIEDALEVGLTEYFEDMEGISIVEWPERIEPLLPQGVLNISIESKGDGGRVFRVNTPQER